MKSNLSKFLLRDQNLLQQDVHSKKTCNFCVKKRVLLFGTGFDLDIKVSKEILLKCLRFKEYNEIVLLFNEDAS